MFFDTTLLPPITYFYFFLFIYVYCACTFYVNMLWQCCIVCSHANKAFFEFEFEFEFEREDKPETDKERERERERERGGRNGDREWVKREKERGTYVEMTQKMDTGRGREDRSPPPPSHHCLPCLHGQLVTD